MFSASFQVQFIQQYHSTFDLFRQSFLVGELIWNFADFATGQSDVRINALNMKGVLTRERQPKDAAFVLKARYAMLANETLAKNS